jgi:hypothetical protein
MSVPAERGEAARSRPGGGEGSAGEAGAVRGCQGYVRTPRQCACSCGSCARKRAEVSQTAEWTHDNLTPR